jgi:hypothetical protein
MKELTKNKRGNGIFKEREVRNNCGQNREEKMQSASQAGSVVHETPAMVLYI